MVIAIPSEDPINAFVREALGIVSKSRSLIVGGGPCGAIGALALVASSWIGSIVVGELLSKRAMALAMTKRAGLGSELMLLIPFFVAGGGDRCNLLHHLGDHGGHGHRIGLVYGYQVLWSLPEGAG